MAARASRRRQLGLALILAAGCRASSELDAPPPRTPERGMVVCEQELAARAGLAILEEGGNAADAAVATALALAVVLPQAGNLGGGGFAVWVPNAGSPQALDFRETAPASARTEFYLDAEGKPIPERSRSGARAIAVPGTPAGLLALHEHLGSGRLSFRDLAQPAIDLARRGFPVDARLARELVLNRAKFADSPAALAEFFPDGEPLAEGALLRQFELAQTLELLVARGTDGFYEGDTAGRIVSEVRRLARAEGLEDTGGPFGAITRDDLRDYEPVWRAPLIGWFRGLEIVTMPPPSAGGIILLETLGVLDGFPIEAERMTVLRERAATGRGGGDALGLDDRIVHWWIEALRRAFAERATHLGDPDFHRVPVDELISSRWIAQARISIGEEAGADPASLLPPQPEGAQTTHLSVIDRQGNAIALTTTLNSTFGSGVMVRGAGFLLNDEMDDFSIGGEPNQFGLVGGEANAIRGGKRPLSTMTPTVVRDSDRRVVLVIGSPGGPKIVTALAGVLLRMLLFDQSLADAVAAPRLHQQWRPPATELEAGWSEEVLAGLERRGHKLRRSVEAWGSVQAIWIGKDGEPVGATDPRRPGAALAQN